MKKIAIMGARGFVGRSLSEYLQGNYQVCPVTRQQVDLLDTQAVEEFVEREQIDVMIHCANEGGSRKGGYDQGENRVLTNNLKMFYNMERLVSEGRRLIAFGSGAQYDKKRDLKKVREEEIGRYLPQDDYGFSKYAISKSLGRTNVYLPIIFGLFGKYEDYTFKFISNAIVKNLLHMPITINQNVVFDYLYLGDFLRLMELLIERDCPWQEFNITPVKSIDLVTAARLINECGGYQSEIIVKNPGYNFEYTGDNTRLLENFPDFTFTPYEEAIWELYEYYREHFDSLDTEAVRQDAAIKHCFTRKKGAEDEEN